MARVISVALPKGGVGKTTTAVNLAASLAVAEQRTLLVDMDISGASGLSLGFTGSMVGVGLYDVFNFVTSFGKAIHRTELKYLDFVPCNVQTLQMEERIQRVADDRSMLRNVLRSVTREYDFVILDCPPTLRGMCTNALAASDSVLVPVKPGHFALDAVDRLFAYLTWLKDVAKKTVEVEGIILTMHEPSTRVDDITVRELNAKYKRYMLETIIPKNSAISEASFFGKPAVLYSVNSRGAASYLALAREIISHNAQRVVTPIQPTIMDHLVNQA